MRLHIPPPGCWGLLATAALLLAGCHHNPYGQPYYHQGPYGPAYGPSFAPSTVPPGGYIQPGPVYTPNGPSLTPFPSNPGSPTPLNPSTPTWRPDPGSPPSNGAPLNDAPPFRPNNPGSNSTNPVPFPLEPDFSSPPPAASLPRAVPIAQAPISPAAASSSTGQNPFQESRRPQSLPTDADPFAFDGGSAPTNNQNPYGYDGSQYSWLRGIVDYDERSKSWSIIYDLTPDIRDKFGGSFVFADHPSLRGLRPGTVVLVRGRVDPGHTDHTGKAMYELQQLVQLSPPSGIQ